MSDEHDQNEGQSVVPAGQLAALVRAELDVAIVTARQYPRSIKAFKTTALQMATLDEETAQSCFYSLPRGGKPIEGPSVRLAEIVGSSWGNLTYGARVVGDDGKILTAQGVCHDLERNVRAMVEVQRRVTGKNGRRFSDDMIVVTGNAACSIALRNAIFKVVPMAYVREVYLRARQVAIGDVRTLAANRAAAVEHFQKMGVPLPRILAVVGKAAIDDVGLDELATLKGLATAIRDGDTTVDEAFPEPLKPGANGASTRADELKSKLNGSKPAEKPPEATGEPAQSGKVPDSHQSPEGQAGSPEDEELILGWKMSIAEAIDFDMLDRLDSELSDLKQGLDGATYAAIAQLLSEKRKLLTEARPGRARQRAGN